MPSFARRPRESARISPTIPLVFPAIWRRSRRPALLSPRLSPTPVDKLCITLWIGSSIADISFVYRRQKLVHHRRKFRISPTEKAKYSIEIKGLITPNTRARLLTYITKNGVTQRSPGSDGGNRPEWRIHDETPVRQAGRRPRPNPSVSATTSESKGACIYTNIYLRVDSGS